MVILGQEKAVHVVELPKVSEVVRLQHLVCSWCPLLPAIGRQLPSGSGREVEPFGAAVVLFTLRLHIVISDARVG